MALATADVPAGASGRHRAPARSAGGARRGARGAGPRIPARRPARVGQAGRRAGLRRRAPGRRRSRARRRAPARAGGSLAAPGPGLAGAPGHPASGGRGARAGDRGGRLPAVRGSAPRLRDRGGGGDGGREPERAAQDPRGAAAVRPPGPDHLRARRAAGDGPLALPGGALRAARRGGRRAAPLGARARRGRRGAPGRGAPGRRRHRPGGLPARRAGPGAPRRGPGVRRGGAHGRARRCPLAWPARAPRRRRATQAAEAARARFDGLGRRGRRGREPGGSAPLPRGGGGHQARRPPRPDRGARPRPGPDRRLAAGPGGGRRGRREPGPGTPIASRSSAPLRPTRPAASTRAARARAPSS